MSANVETLRLRQVRPGVLFAVDWPGRWVPLVLVIALGAWMAGVVGLLAGLGPRPSIVLMVFGVGSLLAVPILLMRGAWMAIDTTRGWVHIRRCWGRRLMRDSFAPNRLTSIGVSRAASPIPGIHGWRIVLRFDHPRLGRVALDWFWSREAAESRARAIAAMLGVTPAGVPAADRSGVTTEITPIPGGPARPHALRFSESDAAPAPPEVIVEPIGPDVRLVLPHMQEMTRAVACWLVYTLIWCFWSWTTLAAHLRPVFSGVVPSPDEQVALGLLIMAALVGLALLHGVIVRLAGAQALEFSAARGWWYSRRWLGLDWQRRRLQLGSDIWIRRVDYPADQAGLWVPDGHDELRLAAGVEADTLVWLLQVLTHPTTAPGMVSQMATAPAADPAALEPAYAKAAARNPASEKPAPAATAAPPAADPGISKRRTARKDGSKESAPRSAPELRPIPQ
jgi:hypothetical protein